MIFDDYGATIIQSSKFNAISKHTKIFNLCDLTDSISVKLPDDFPRCAELTDLFDFDNNKSLDFEEFVTRLEQQPWIDIKTNSLDLANGQHIYKLTFERPDDSMTCSCWFSYIIQNANEEKPYIYMKREIPTNSEDADNEDISQG